MFLYKFSQGLNYLTPQKIRIAFTTKMLEFSYIVFWSNNKTLPLVIAHENLTKRYLVGKVYLNFECQNTRRTYLTKRNLIFWLWFFCECREYSIFCPRIKCFDFHVYGSAILHQTKSKFRMGFFHFLFLSVYHLNLIFETYIIAKKLNLEHILSI
jgi:hypothetical protein